MQGLQLMLSAEGLARLPGTVAWCLTRLPGCVQIGFGAVVYPSLILTYLGQAAMIVNDPSTAATAYWSALPHPV